jgi:prepilin-type N-terminal cleavage/methylation domain-containing protein
MNRRRSDSRGFTLVELLVVITIIGMLMGLILPAVQSARENSRRAKCINNLKQLSLAATSFESSQGTFPGWEMAVGGGTAAGSGLSWGVWLLPYLERNDLFSQFEQGGGTAVSLQIFVCPSDPSDGSVTNGPSSYIANGWVFQDGLCTKPQFQGVSTTAIPDGCSQTLMISENLQTCISSAGTTAVAHYHSWADVSAGSTATVNSTTVYLSDTTFGTNFASQAVSLGYSNSLVPSSGIPSFIANNTTYSDAVIDNLESNHSVGACAAFCDGHVILLRGDISPIVYEQLVNPNDQGLSGGWGNSPPAALDDSTYSFPN